MRRSPCAQRTVSNTCLGFIVFTPCKRAALSVGWSYDDIVTNIKVQACDGESILIYH